ncbi:MAG TPA: MotA/TolQ/ExbB proton channel family protein [Gemmatimonadales bacterium]|nr:MotA/TolQ/ExbB proton channel family protein [Gemmatimonadales bacterium]
MNRPVGAREPAHQEPHSGAGSDFGSEQQDQVFQNLLALVLAVSATLVLYLALAVAFQVPPLGAILGRVPDTGIPWFAAVMLSRGMLQPLNFCLFAVGASLLILRFWNLRREHRAFRHEYISALAGARGAPGSMVIGEAERGQPLEAVRQIAEEYPGTLPLLIRRLEAGSVRLAEGGDAAEVHAIMQAVAENDRKVAEGRYTLIRYLSWLIPTIGFLGTVIGMGQAISGFSGVMGQVGRGGGELQGLLQPLLGSISGNLGVAFDTTVLALLLSAVIVALASVVQSREEGLLSSIDDFAVRQFTSRIAVPDLGTKQLSEMLQSALMGLAQMMSQGKAGEGEEAAGGGFRDLAGLLAAQGEQTRKAVEAMTAAAEKISKAMPSPGPGRP